MPLVDKSYQDLLYLIRCALREEPVSSDWHITTPLATLLKLATFHSIEAVLYDVVKLSFTSEEDKPVVIEWGLAHDKVFRRYLLFEAERTAILSEMSKKGIWAMVLKGVVLKNYYPKPHCRQMADNDILFDGSKRQEVKEIMLSRQYTIGHYQGAYDDVYYKDPLYNFEMHVKLSVAPQYKAYFDGIEERLVSVGAVEKQLTDSDFYLYVLAHELKHYSVSGSGLRGLIDLYYYMKKEKERLDWDFLSEQMSRLGMLSFDQERHTLMRDLFSGDLAAFQSTFYNTMLMRYCQSGTYGTLDQFVDTKLSEQIETRHAFLSYYFKKVFLIHDNIQNSPFLQKYKIALPFFVVYRLIKGLFNQRNWQELRLVIRKTLDRKKS